MSQIISPKITEAIEFAVLAHGDQKRNNGRAYITHPLSVGFILQSAGYGEDVVIAGLLHDVVEDTSYTESDIREKFGERVAHLVMGVTEDGTITDWVKRKEKYLDHLKTSEKEVQAISAADMLDNRRSILREMKSGFDIWSKFSVGQELVMKNTEDRLAIVKESLDNEITKELEVVVNEIKTLLDS